MTRQCGAQTRSGEPCRRPAKTGSARCQLHGGRAGRPPGTPMHDNTRAAIAEGRRRWVERMREAKERGEINRFPNGRRAKGLSPLSKDPKIRKAQRFVEKVKAMAEREIATIRELPWEELTHPQKLDIETGKALDIAAKILNDGAQMLERAGIEGVDTKLLMLVKDTAMQIISAQLRVDAAVLVASASAPVGLNDPERREKARQMILAAFAEHPRPGNGGLDRSE